MTQKELLYVEDAIEHENSIIKICNSVINNLNDDSFVSFMNEELVNHTDIKNELLELLRGKSNEQ